MTAKASPTYRTVTARMSLTASVTARIPSPHILYDHMSVEAFLRRAKDAIQPLLMGALKPVIEGAKAKLAPFGILIEVQDAKVDVDEA
jgi:hypothetical protein